MHSNDYVGFRTRVGVRGLVRARPPANRDNVLRAVLSLLRQDAASWRRKDCRRALVCVSPHRRMHVHPHPSVVMTRPNQLPDRRLRLSRLLLEQPARIRRRGSLGRSANVIRDFAFRHTPRSRCCLIVVRTTFLADVAPLYNPEGIQIFPILCASRRVGIATFSGTQDVDSSRR